jgi:hypothetical protein
MQLNGAGKERVALWSNWSRRQGPSASVRSAHMAMTTKGKWSGMVTRESKLRELFGKRKA